MDPISTTNLPVAQIVDELLGNSGGNTRRITIHRLAALVSALMGPTYATRAELYADLGWPAQSVGYVRADPNTAFNGVYKKSGNSGSGSWSRVGDLPTGAIEMALIDTVNSNGVKFYNNRAEAEASAVGLPAGIQRIMVIEAFGASVRARNSEDDALYGSVPYWGISRRLITVEEVQSALAAEAAARLAADNQLRDALRAGALMPLTGVSYSSGANSYSAAVDTRFGALAVTGMQDGCEAYFVPDAVNAGQNPTVGVGLDTTRGVRRSDGTAWPAGGFAVGRPYVLRRSGNQLLVVRGEITHLDLAAEASARTAAIAAETTARSATDGALREAIRSGGIIPLAEIGGTGDAWTAQLAPAVIAAGITSLNNDATVEYIPALPNANANPTGTVAGTSFNIRNADGGGWPAFGFVVGRSYTLRRRGNVLRVIGDVAQPDLAAARSDRIIGDAQMGSVLLEGIAGTGDAITATMPGTLTAIGISAANIREILFTVPAANTGSVHPTMNIDGQGAVQIRDYRDAQLPAVALVPGSIYRAVKIAGRWRLVTAEVDRAALQAAIEGSAQTLQASIDTGDLRIMSEDRQVAYVGASRATIDANPAAAAANAINWVFPEAASGVGDAGRFRAQISSPGTIRFGIFQMIAGLLVRVRSRDVAVTAGFVDVPIGLHRAAGEYLGAYMGDARVRFVSGGGFGYYFDNSTSDRSIISATNLNTTNLLTAQFVIYQGSSPTVADRTAVTADVANLTSRVESLEYGGRVVQPFVMTDDARLGDPAAPAAAAWNFVFDSLRPAGNVVRVEFWARNAGTLRLGAYVRSGTSFTRRTFVDIAATVGFNRHEVNLGIREGEYVGYRPTAAILPFQSVSPLGTETGVWFNNNANDLGSFTATLNATQQHLIKIVQAIGEEAGTGAAAAVEAPHAGITRIAHTQTANSVDVAVTVINSAGAETTATGTFAIPATASTIRYDLITYDHGTNTLARLAGIERTDAANVQPAVTVPGQQAVLRIRAGTGGITSVAPIPEMVGAVPRASRALLDRAVVAGRAALPKLMTRIALRQPIRIMGFGDSITALANGSTSQTQANGTGRDRITGPYLTNSGIYEAEALAAIPLYTSLQLGRPDNGAGAVHTRIGINWRLVERLEARGWVLGTDLWYDNHAIPGTGTVDMWDDATDSPKAWLASIPTAASAAPNVVILATGMNERGYAAGREARFTKVVNWLRGQGIEVIITTCARPAALVNEARWTNAMLARVARNTGAACIPLEAIWEDAAIGALGLNVEDVCHANRGPTANHPATIELPRYGNLLAELVP